MAQTSSSQVKDLGNGMFDLPVWKDPELSDEFQDLWFVELGLDPLKHLPPIPEEYEQEWSEKRCVYLFGVPNGITQDQLQPLLEQYGEVHYLPLVIDLLSQQVFRWAIMASNPHAELVAKHFTESFPKKLIPADHHGSIAAMTALAPGRGRIRGAVVVAQDDINRFLNKPIIWGYNQELGPGQNPNSKASTMPPANPKHTKKQMRSAINKAKGIIGNPIFQPVAGSGTQGFGWPSVPDNYLSPSPVTAQQPGSGSTLRNSIFDTPTPIGGRRTSAFASIFNTPSKVNRKENVDFKQEGNGQEGDMNIAAAPNQRTKKDDMNITAHLEYATMNIAAPENRGSMNTTVAQNQIGVNNNGYYSYWGKDAAGMTQNPGSFRPNAYYGYTRPSTQAAAYRPYYADTQNMFSSPSSTVDPLVVLLRKSAIVRKPVVPYTPMAQASTNTQPPVPRVVQQPAPIVPARPTVTPSRKPSNPLVAVPDIAILNERARSMSISKGGPAPKATSAKKTSAVKKTPLATIPEAYVPFLQLVKTNSNQFLDPRLSRKSQSPSQLQRL